MLNGDSAVMEEEEAVWKGKVEGGRLQGARHRIAKGVITVCVGLKIEVDESALRRGGHWQVAVLKEPALKGVS